MILKNTPLWEKPAPQRVKDAVCQSSSLQPTFVTYHELSWVWTAYVSSCNMKYDRNAYLISNGPGTSSVSKHHPSRSDDNAQKHLALHKPTTNTNVIKIVQGIDYSVGACDMVWMLRLIGDGAGKTNSAMFSNAMLCEVVITLQNTPLLVNRHQHRLTNNIYVEVHLYIIIIRNSTHLQINCVTLPWFLSVNWW